MGVSVDGHIAQIPYHRARVNDCGVGRCAGDVGRADGECVCQRVFSADDIAEIVKTERICDDLVLCYFTGPVLSITRSAAGDATEFRHFGVPLMGLPFASRPFRGALVFVPQLPLLSVTVLSMRSIE